MISWVFKGSMTQTSKIIESKAKEKTLPEKIEEKEKKIENRESSCNEETTTTSTAIEDSNRDQGKQG